MSKIICDVCGTSYPETALQCPICGCVRPGEVKVVAGDTEQTEQKPVQSYSRVKGGRFSKSNVRKRNTTGETVSEVQLPKKPAYIPEQENKEESTKKKDVGLTVTVLLLLLAIIAVAVYIVIRFLVPMFSTQDKPAADTKPSISVTIPLVELSVETEVTLNAENPVYQLNVTGADETVTYSSSDPQVAEVSEDGIVTAVGTGEAVIYVTCGDYTVECRVICDMATEETNPEDTTPEETTPDETTPEETIPDETIPEETEPEETDPPVVEGELTISHEEVTMIASNPDRNSFVLTLKDADGNIVDVVWREDYNVCQIEGNKITIIRSDPTRVMVTEVYAEINDVVYKCKILVYA